MSFNKRAFSVCSAFGIKLYLGIEEYNLDAEGIRFLYKG
jgi:hypothetical protein